MVTPQKDFLTLVVRLVEKGRAFAPHVVFVNGERSPDPSAIQVRPQPRIDVQVEEESGREYWCRIELT